MILILIIDLTIIVCYHWTPVINWSVGESQLVIIWWQRQRGSCPSPISPVILHCAPTQTSSLTSSLLPPRQGATQDKPLDGNWRRTPVWSHCSVVSRTSVIISSGGQQDRGQGREKGQLRLMRVTCWAEDEGRRQWRQSDGLIPPEELQRLPCYTGYSGYTGHIALNHQSVTILYKSNQTGNTGDRAGNQRYVTFRYIAPPGRTDFYRDQRQCQPQPRDWPGLVSRNNCVPLPSCVLSSLHSTPLLIFIRVFKIVILLLTETSPKTILIVIRQAINHSIRVITMLNDL